MEKRLVQESLLAPHSEGIPSRKGTGSESRGIDRRDGNLAQASLARANPAQTNLARASAKADGADKDALTRELLELARKSELTRDITTVLFHPGFPVDVRHNSKIFREKLAVWAAEQVR